MFRTEITLETSRSKINHQTPITTIGSCFSDCMGRKFRENKFEVLSNPFGTVYNPVSISALLNYSLKNHSPDESSYIESQGLWTNFNFHSSFSHQDKDVVNERVEMAIKQTHDYLNKSSWLIITLGTSFVYKRTDNSVVVANCHKLPARNFSKHLLSQTQILSELTPSVERLKEFVPDINVIITVSPVRHIKDTIEQNMVSKSTLRLVANTLSETYNYVYYFPSYEIMMDDLRDYRFYKSDMIHPDKDAENYIWDKFSGVYFNQDTIDLLQEWAKVRSALNHKAFNPTSSNHQNFIKQTIDRVAQLQNKLDVEEELNLLKRQLVK